MSRPDPDAGKAIRDAVGAVQAPARLREELATQRVRLVRRRRTVGAVAATAATVLAAALALSQTGGDPRPPTIAEAAAIALRAPALPAPEPAAASGVLQASSGGVAFPDYSQGDMRWRPNGQRRARRGGRDIAVVTYAIGHKAYSSYAIVDGPALRLTDAARTVERGGTRYTVARHGGATVVAWHKGGRTCVLASRKSSAEALLRMAAWKPPKQAGAPY